MQGGNCHHVAHTTLSCDLPPQRHSIAETEQGYIALLGVSVGRVPAVVSAGIKRTRGEAFPASTIQSGPPAAVTRRTVVATPAAFADPFSASTWLGAQEQCTLVAAATPVRSIRRTSPLWLAATTQRPLDVMSSATGAVIPPAGDKAEEEGVVFTRVIAVSAPLPPSATTSSSLLGTNCIPPNACVVATCAPAACPTNATIETLLWLEPVAKAT